MSSENAEMDSRSQDMLLTDGSGDASRCLISIVTVNYNGASTLPRLLDSVGMLLRRHKDFEHVIIDGASKDDSVEALRAYAAVHPNATFISERDSGIYDAMNKGVRRTRGRYFIHINSDDEVIFPERWDAAAALLRERGPLVLTTPVSITRGKETVRVLPGRPLSNLHRRLGYHFPHQGTFFARQLFDLADGYSTSIGYIADKIFCYQLLDQINDSQVLYDPYPVAIQHAGGVSSRSPLTPIKTFLLALKSARHIKYRNPYLRALLNPLFKIYIESMRTADALD